MTLDADPRGPVIVDNNEIDPDDWRVTCWFLAIGVAFRLAVAALSPRCQVLLSAAPRTPKWVFSWGSRDDPQPALPCPCP